MLKRIKALLLLLLLLSVEGSAQFEFARLKYDTRWGSLYPENFVKGWFTDYSDFMDISLESHLLPVLSRLTSINVGKGVVVGGDKEVFKYPFLYTVEPEQLDLNKKEAGILGEWLRRGGFWLLDDFHGCNEFDHVVAQVRRTMPNEMILFKSLTTSHPIFHTVYNIDEIVQVPVVGIGVMCNSFPGCIMYEENAQPPCNEPMVLIWEKHGGGTVVLAWNVDLGDGMEHADDPNYPMRFSGYSARFFTNVIVYSMSH